MNKNTIIKKIKEYYNFKSYAALANFLGVTSQTLSNWKSRNSYNHKLINQKFPDLNPQWLLTGDPPMLKEGYNNANPIEQIINESRLAFNKKTPYIPLYDLENGITLKDVLKGKVTAKSILNLIQIPEIPNCDGGTYVTGDSMHPLLKNRDIIIFKIVAVEDIFWGEMYLVEILLENGAKLTTIRHVQESDLGEGYIKLVSENINYSAKDIPINKINAIALIRASIRLH